jgi:hypothetical protein
MSAAKAGLAIVTAIAIANGKYFRNDTARPTPVTTSRSGAENLIQIACVSVYRRRPERPEFDQAKRPVKRLGIREPNNNARPVAGAGA